MWPCIAGGCYRPGLCDVVIMVEKTGFMGLGGLNRVKGAVGQVIDAESLGGAAMHTRISGVAHFMAKDDADCLALIRQQFRTIPEPAPRLHAGAPAKAAEGLYDRLPAGHRAPYEVNDIPDRIFAPHVFRSCQPGR